MAKPVRAALLCHDRFSPEGAKTAVCILRHRGRYEPVAVIDRSRAGQDAVEAVGPVGRGIPVVASMHDAVAHRPDVLVIGIAPIGGRLPDAWRPDIEAALRAGLEVHSGLHTFLGDDPDLASLAREHGARIWDVRKPTRPPRIATGEGRDVDALVVHTVGTDCSGGKMTTAWLLVEEARRRGLRAAFVATGQTGMMLGGDEGAPIDRIVSDFVAGAAEEMVLACDRAGFDLIVVEGQGSLTHPAYSGVTLGLLHGSYPDLFVLCHVAGRTHHHDYETPPRDFPLLPLPAMRDLVERAAAPVHPSRVAAIALATHRSQPDEARAAALAATDATGLPAGDVVRDGPAWLFDSLARAAGGVDKPGARRVAQAALQRPAD